MTFKYLFSTLSYRELTNLLYDLDFKFKVIAITEIRLITKEDPKKSFEISYYHMEHTPTKSEKGGALLYISKKQAGSEY